MSDAATLTTLFASVSAHVPPIAASLTVAVIASKSFGLLMVIEPVAAHALSVARV